MYLAVCVPLGAEVAVKLVDMEKLERAEEAAGGLVGSGQDLGYGLGSGVGMSDLPGWTPGAMSTWAASLACIELARVLLALRRGAIAARLASVGEAYGHDVQIGVPVCIFAWRRCEVYVRTPPRPPLTSALLCTVPLKRVPTLCWCFKLRYCQNPHHDQ